MKCPVCDGTGTVVHPMMSMNGDEYTGEWEQHECEACNGTGEFDPNEVDRFNAVDVIKVMEMVKNPQTNEEMLRGCTFEEMAGAIYEWYTLGYTRGKNGVKLNSITEVVEWLKEKHDGNVL